LDPWIFVDQGFTTKTLRKPCRRREKIREMSQKGLVSHLSLVPFGRAK